MPGESLQPDFSGATGRWLERAVIGLGLCPFAAAVYEPGRVRFVVSEACTAADLRADLCVEVLRLATCAPRECETTLLIRSGRDLSAQRAHAAEAGTRALAATLARLRRVA